MSLFVSLQKALPQHGLSRLGRHIADSRNPQLSRFIIRRFAAHYGVDMSEAANPDLSAYPSFNDFFTRALREGARPMPEDPRALISPADGAVSQAGQISGESLLQAKGHEYSLSALLASVELAREFTDGFFATIYLSPRDYHRVHAPWAGTLVRTIAVPGALFSVNEATTVGVPGLFARNERLVMVFDTAVGPAALVMVGAMIVASIETPFDTPASPYQRLLDTPHAQPVERGDEIGRFLLGSTAIVVLPHECVAPLDVLAPGRRVRMGETLGLFTRARN